MDLLILAMLRASHFVLVALGFSLVFGSCRVLNLMHGSYVMLGAYGSYAFGCLFLRCGGSPGLAALFGTTVGALATGLFGFAFFKLLQVTRRTKPEHILVISVAGNLFICRIVRYWYGAQGRSVSPVLDGSVALGRVRIPTSELLIPACAVLCLASLWFWLHRTRSGLALRAVADSPSSAELSGVDAGKVLAGAVGIAALIGGLAGALHAPTQTLTPNMWVQPLLVSFAVVVFGGRNRLLGVVLSAALLAGVETATSWYWSEAASQYVALVVIALGLFCFPTGLLGSPRYENR